MHDRLIRLGVFVGTSFEPWALRQAYLFAPTVDFSRTILETSSSALAVAEAPSITWCDLGTPERVVRSLRKLGAWTPWLAMLGSDGWF